MNQTLIEIFKSREDISDYVFHFTKGRKAKEVLNEILRDATIKDINGNGYMCFTEAPVTMLPSMFKIFKKYIDPMYAPFGIGIKRNVFYHLGGRPVIYGTKDDKDILPTEMHWRFVPLYPDSYDFSWLREWRIPVPRIEITYDNCFVIVDTNKDLDEMKESFIELEDIDIDSQPEDGGVLSEYIGHFTRMFKVVAIEEIEEINNMGKQQLEKILNEQEGSFSNFLGSTWE